MDGGEPAVKDKTVETGTLLDKPASEPTKEGHTFAGWYKDERLTQAFDFATEKIAQHTTLYAKWVALHTVTFESNGGSKVESKTVAHEETVEQPSPNPTKEDFVFVGWHKDKTLTQRVDFTTEKITANTTLYALWEFHILTAANAERLSRIDKNTGTLTITQGVTAIELRAFENKGLSESVIMPNSVTTIEGYTFYQTSLTSVVIPNGVTYTRRSSFLPE